ncbi:MAG: hypothetical protein Kow0092_36970 [Deferrisomatales bacterium]
MAPSVRHPILGALGVALALLAGGCASTPGAPGRGRALERSADRAPAWITQLPQEKGYFFAAGVASGAASLEEGKSRALRAAVEDVVGYLGVQAQVQYQETRTELATRLVNRISAAGAGRVSGGRTVEMYYERYPSPEDQPPGSRFDVYVLLRIPETVLGEERDRLERDRQRRIALAARLLQEGRTRRDAGDAGGALRRWAQAAHLVAGEWGVEDLAREASSAIADLTGGVALVRAGSPTEPEDTGPWKVRAVLRIGAAETPLRWLPLKAVYRAGPTTGYTQALSTDETGTVLVPAPVRTNLASPVSVRVVPDVDRLLAPAAAPRAGAMAGAAAALESASLWLTPPVWGESPPSSDARQRSPGARPAATEDRGPPPPVTPDSAHRPAPRAIDIRVTPARTRVLGGWGRDAPELGVLVDLRAPPEAAPRRRPLNVALVVDRSGSMGKERKIEFVKEAVRLVARNLQAADRLSVVVYSDRADVLVSGGDLHDRLLVEHHLDMLRPSGATNLSAGLFEGVAQARASRTEGALSRIVLLSDGLANRGVVSPEDLASYARKLPGEQLSVSTVGVGDEFDEALLMGLASAGGGNYHYVSAPEDLPAVFLEEFHRLASLVAQNVTLRAEPAGGAELVDTFGYPHEQTPDGAVVRVGDLVAGGRILVGLTLRLPAATRGSRDVATVSLSYDQLLGTTKRVERRFPIRVGYETDPGRPAETVDPTATRYLQVLAAMDAMTLSMRSGDDRAVRETVRYLEEELGPLKQWSQQTDDPDVTALAQVFEECLVSLRRMGSGTMMHGAPRDDRAARAVRYRLYRFRRSAR